MSTARSSPYGGGGGSLSGILPDRDPPGQRVPDQDKDPLEGTWDERQRPPGRNMDQVALQEVAPYRDPLPMDRMTDMCENITLPQISFACGK